MGSGARAFRFEKSRFRKLGVRNRCKKLLRGGRPRRLGGAEPASPKVPERCARSRPEGEPLGVLLPEFALRAPLPGSAVSFAEKSPASGRGLSIRGAISRFRNSGVSKMRRVLCFRERNFKFSVGSLAARRSSVSGFLGRAARSVSDAQGVPLLDLKSRFAVEKSLISRRFARSAFRCSEFPALAAQRSSMSDV